MAKGVPPSDGPAAEPARPPAGMSASPERLTRRADFLAARAGRKAHASTLSLQALARPEPDAAAVGAPRAGFTVTKREGGAVERNRIRRRLREALRRLAPLHARAGHDYVLVGRRAALDASFEAILTDLRSAFGRVHGARRPKTTDSQPAGPEAARR